MPRFAFLNQQNRTYIPSLDGIRAVAAMLVFVAHAGWMDIVPGGFGVTIFFFLSGYLITTLLRREFEYTGSISFSKFYLRRAYRIFPPLYIVLILIFFLAVMGVVEHHMHVDAVLSQIFFWTNYYNLAYGATGDYFVPTTGVSWSLAVEEHFYFIFPLVFLMVLRRMNYAGMARIFFLFCAIALLWRCWLVLGLNLPAAYTYSATDARFDSLLYGCILGVWRNPVFEPEWKFSLRPLAALLIAVILLLITFVLRDETFRATLRYTMQGVALFPIFWLAIRYSEWPIFSWLNWPFVRYLGAISYTFYLSHGMALIFAGHLVAEKVPRAMLGFVFTFLFSTLMYVLVEHPLAKYRQQLHGDSTT